MYKSAYVSPVLNPTVTPKLYYLETGNVNIPASNTINLMDEGGDGELKGFTCATSSKSMIFEVILFGDNNTTLAINNKTMQDVLGLCMGLSPGDVETLPNGRSQDKTGTTNVSWPYLVRYKDDTMPDYLGNTTQDYILNFSPSEPIPYRRIQINLKNTSTATINVRLARVAGAIYEITNPAIPTPRTPEPTGTPLTTLRSPNVRGERPIETLTDEEILASASLLPPTIAPVTEKNLATSAAEQESQTADTTREKEVTLRTAATPDSTEPKGKPVAKYAPYIDDSGMEVDPEEEEVDEADEEKKANEAKFFSDVDEESEDYEEY